MVTPTHPAHSPASAPDVTDGVSSPLIRFGCIRWWGFALFMHVAHRPLHD